MKSPRFFTSTILFIVFALTVNHDLQAQTYNPKLKPYVDFLNTEHLSAKDYVLNLFKTKDIVILCERHHQDTTQYDLYLSIIGDKRFIEEVGNVFTEKGVSTLNPEVNAFLHTDGLTEDSARRRILAFHRNADWVPLWEKENFSYLLRGIYFINQKLRPDQKINYYPSDVPFDWTQMDVSRYRKFVNSLEPGRDSIIALQIINTFDSLKASKSSHKKALVIMNYRHAFGHNFRDPLGGNSNNVGRYLFDKYGDRVANVYVNFLAEVIGPSNNESYRLIHDGKWDASFKLLGKENLGFDFADSPFGNDNFDLWPWITSFKFSDIFTGFVYWLPLEKHRLVIGIPGIIDSSSAQEMIRRHIISNTVAGRTNTVTVEELKSDYNERRVHQYDKLDSLTAVRDRWLH